jgi:hypothetical protein
VLSTVISQKPAVLIAGAGGALNGFPALVTQVPLGTFVDEYVSRLISPGQALTAAKVNWEINKKLIKVNSIFVIFIK